MGGTYVELLPWPAYFQPAVNFYWHQSKIRDKWINNKCIELAIINRCNINVDCDTLCARFRIRNSLDLISFFIAFTHTIDVHAKEPTRIFQLCYTFQQLSNCQQTFRQITIFLLYLLLPHPMIGTDIRWRNGTLLNACVRMDEWKTIKSEWMVNL